MSAIMQDYKHLARKTWMDYWGEVWLKYKLKIALWEMEKQARHQAEWRWVAMQCQDRLRQLGVDPNQQPEDLTKMFELWIAGGIVLFTILCALFFNLYRSELLTLIQRSM